MAGKDQQLVLAQTVVARPTAAPTRAQQIAAAGEKVRFEIDTDMGEQRTRCMTGEEALSAIDFKPLKDHSPMIKLNPVDICLARQDRSVDFDLSGNSYSQVGGIHAPYSDIMRSRGNGSIEASKLAMRSYQAVVEMLRKGEVKEDGDKSVTFSIGKDIKPLKLIPGLAFDLGFTTKTAAIMDGTEVAEKPKRTDDQIREEALACIGNNEGNVKCYDLGRDRANLQAQVNTAIRKGAIRQARSQ